jgi:hypothetical protein
LQRVAHRFVVIYNVHSAFFRNQTHANTPTTVGKLKKKPIFS